MQSLIDVLFVALCCSDAACLAEAMQQRGLSSVSLLRTDGSRLLTSDPRFKEYVRLQCRGNHEHVWTRTRDGKREYPVAMIRRLVNGVVHNLRPPSFTCFCRKLTCCCPPLPQFFVACPAQETGDHVSPAERERVQQLIHRLLVAEGDVSKTSLRLLLQRRGCPVWMQHMVGQVQCDSCLDFGHCLQDVSVFLASIFVVRSSADGPLLSCVHKTAARTCITRPCWPRQVTSRKRIPPSSKAATASRMYVMSGARPRVIHPGREQQEFHFVNRSLGELHPLHLKPPEQTGKRHIHSYSFFSEPMKHTSSQVELHTSLQVSLVFLTCLSHVTAVALLMHQIMNRLRALRASKRPLAGFTVKPPGQNTSCKERSASSGRV